MLLSSSAIPHTQKPGILGVIALLIEKKVYYFKVNNTDGLIVFVILQQLNDSVCFHVLYENELNGQLGQHHINWHCEEHTLSYALSYRWTVTIHLSCKSEFPISAVNPVCYVNIKSYSHFENTVEINFTLIESKIPLLLFQLSFSHLNLMLPCLLGL